MQTIVSLVAAGMGVALVPASLQHLRRTGVVYRPLAERSRRSRSGSCGGGGEAAPAVRAFVALRATRGPRGKTARSATTSGPRITQVPQRSNRRQGALDAQGRREALPLAEAAPPGTREAGTMLFVHGSSMASQPTFDLHVPGRPDSSVMDWFAARGFDTWCMDNEGYGRSDKQRPINCDISNGADDLAAGTEYILKTTGAKKLLVYGISSGALKAALFAQRHPERVARLALDAFVWTGEGSPTLAERRKKLPEFQSKNRRPIDRAFVHSIFNRDHPGTRRRGDRSTPSPTRSSRSTIRCRPAPTSTCARSCRSSIRRRSPCRRS